jgi:hypothetical protein
MHEEEQEKSGEFYKTLFTFPVKMLYIGGLHFIIMVLK